MRIDLTWLLVLVWIAVWPEHVGRIAAEVYNNFEIYSARYELWQK